jgi:hypothetical protein
LPKGAIAAIVVGAVPGVVLTLLEEFFHSTSDRNANA